ncbi:ATP-grasp domain-containing protein [Gammaproteobacteria bacterium]|nr:ATP-grasp domain-containing protein [Gammaproteobacteria bacterium]
MFKRILVANRGAVARRIIRACDDLDCQSVAVYSDIDSGLPHVNEASSAERLPGYRPVDTYLNGKELVAAAQRADVDAIHPGYGFLAENADFARAVEAAGLKFIGPSASWLERMGEKTRARQWMQENGFPMHAGSGLILDQAMLLEAAESIGYPVILKPAAGGGGIGMIVADDPEALTAAYATASHISERTFGQSTIFLEKFLRDSRHVEVQLIGDGESLMALYERDCSVQRRHQKLIEESPAPKIARADIDELSRRAVEALAGYDSLGTVETMYSQGRFGFLEMNTRLQVEHGVTEEVTGVDLVRLQIRIASGEKLSTLLLEQPKMDGYAVEARVYAEDPGSMLPCPGHLSVFRVPEMEGVRIEACYREGNTVTPYYDPLLAKVIGKGATRETAIGRTLIALRAMEVNGVKTNAPLLCRILESARFIEANLDTAFVGDLL